MTGAAAVEIIGDTTSRKMALNRKSNATVDDIDRFKDTRLNIIDEVSFAGIDDLRKLSEKMQAYTECCDQIYGSIPICFIGDFCQLPVIGGTKIYVGDPSIYWEQALTHMVELDGHHRYADDPALGNAMAEARDGNPTALRQMLVDRVITTGKVQIPPGHEARYASFTNRKRAAINANIFKKYLETFHHQDESMESPEGALVIRSNAKWYTSRKPLGHAAHQRLWEQCSDGHVVQGSKRADPFLCLFYGCELMVNANLDVKLGIANGKCCTFEKAVLKAGKAKVKTKIHGRWVYAVDVVDVDHLVLRFEKKKGANFVGTFKLKHTCERFTVDYPADGELTKAKRMKVNLMLDHFPLLSNYATTGHKLQGKTIEHLVIAEWRDAENWAYVVLSRVRTLLGIFLWEPLPDHITFAPDPEYISMMGRLRNTILAVAEDLLELLF